MTIPTYGTPEHAALITKDRHPGVKTAMAWLCDSHLPPTLKTLSRPMYTTAVELLERIPNDSAELTSALNRLVEAKDWFVRAGIHSDQGKPGPVPRPATVVDPPTARDLMSGDQARIDSPLGDEAAREAWARRAVEKADRAVRDASHWAGQAARDVHQAGQAARDAAQAGRLPVPLTDFATVDPMGDPFQDRPIHHYDDPEA